MKLAYLWIEEFKSIKQMGINFIPNLSFNYDVSNNKINLEEKNDFCLNELKNIHGIIAKNGGGKTSILVSILTHFLNNKITNWAEYFFKTPIRVFCIFQNGNDYILEGKYIEEKIPSFYIKEQLVEFSANSQDKLCYYYNFLPETIISNYSNSYMPNFFNDNDQILVYPSKKESKIDIKEIENDVVHSILELQVLKTNYNDHENTLDFFKPNYLFFGIQDLRKHLSIENVSTLISEKFDDFKSTYDDLLSIVYRPTADNFNTYFKLTILMRWIKLINTVYLDFQNITFESSIIQPLRNIQEIIKLDNHKNNIDNIIKIVSALENAFSKDNDFNIFDKFNSDLAFIRNTLKLVNKLKSNSKCIQYSFRDTIGLLFPLTKLNKMLRDSISEKQDILTIDLVQANSTHNNDFLTNSKTYNTLSNGEKHLTILAYLINHQINERCKDNNKSFIILLDEVDVGLHFEWQKKFIHYLSQYILMDNIQIIFTTHSAITASDLPNSHVTFIKNNEIYEPEYNTFGGNLIELLKESFEQNGFVGDIAKSYIDEIKQFCFSNISKIYSKQTIDLDALEKKLSKYKSITDNIGDLLIKNDLKSCISVLEQALKVYNDQN